MSIHDTDDVPQVVIDIVHFKLITELGLVLYRIAMIFTALRKFENGDASEKVICTDQDFDSALKLADIFLQHSLLMFHNLPKQNENAVFRSGDNKRKFFEAIPHDFKRAFPAAIWLLF